MAERLLAGLAARAAAQPEEAARRVIVEVSDRPVVATVLRAGREMPVAEVNNARLEELLGTIRPQAPTHVIHQSVAAGSVVPRGTTVDIVMVTKSDVTLDIFRGVHAALAGRSIAEIADADALDEEVVAILTRRPEPGDTTDAERATITRALAGLGADVDDQDPARSYGAGHRALRNAVAFRL